MDWKIADAKESFSEVVRAAETEPQRIYNRDRLVAAIVDAESFAEFEQWRSAQKARSIGDRFAELREILREENYVLRIPRRRNRPNPFDDDDLSR